MQNFAVPVKELLFFCISRFFFGKSFDFCRGMCYNIRVADYAPPPFVL